ncbi:cysteine desulfurase [Vibrio sp. JC009]|uniref:cysteine desulfurase family protein n=1 Tax=Vibrio sp. JC009 TaxID=2912314 RepID=UPI0023B0CE24|nr:cysteine desulfurase family protein [Vibrio sp. JC009]WED22803.1 cysteine desulfurase [Vibrio sp. JC009]
MTEYYDYAASTPIADAVLEDMKPWFQNNFANPSASHNLGEKASYEIKKAREVIAEKIGAMPAEIIFTSGASEANNLAIKGIAFKHLDTKGHIITSSIEHKCVLNTCSFLESIGFDVTYLEPDNNGVISPESVQQALRDDTILISIHHVNNELGTIQPIQEYGSIAFDAEIPFHTDAAQSFCKLDIDVEDSDIDMLSLSGHKIFGPKGIGALYIRDGKNSGIVPLIHGGGQEMGLRGGTSPTPLIIGLASAVKHFPQNEPSVISEFKKVLSEYSYQRNGGENVVPSIWNITFSSEEEALNFQSSTGWLISQGSACNAMSNVASHVLSAIGLNEEEARRSYRISLPPYHISE